MGKQDFSQNNKRIDQNTLLLYCRMLLLMVVTLYTSRVVLSALGIDDFGIYTIIGGVVTMFSMLTGSLSSAISRFITYELGTGNQVKLKKIFSSAVTIQIVLGLIVTILAEVIGLWFLNNKMVIPHDRIIAANWVLHLSLLTFIINLISVPYNAAIIAHEKMSAFAYISIIDAAGKLCIAYFITISPTDKLIFYAIMMCLSAMITRLIYGVYCKRKFEECKYQFIWNKKLLKQMFEFAGWNFIGSSSALLRDQGGNIIINLFCGPTVNAAKGIANQVNAAVNSFVTNFMIALNPQITKSYASGNHKYMMMLIFQGARLSYYMLLLLSLPIIINTQYILTLWLKEVPNHTALFVQSVLIFTMSESISTPLITAMLATGNIRNYQIVVGGLQIMNLPISYILLRSGYIPESVIFVAIFISQCCLAARLIMLRNIIQLEIRQYLKKVYFNIIIVSLLSGILPIIVSFYIKCTFINFIILCFISLVNTSIVIFYIGCNKKERYLISSKIKKIYKTRFNTNILSI